MAQANDPLKPVLDAVWRYQKRIQELIGSVFNKLRSSMGKAIAFMDNVVKYAKEIAKKVGKGVVNTIVSMRNRIFAAVNAVPGLAKSALKLGYRIIATIQKAADPNKVIKVVKKLFQTYVRMIRQLADYVSDMVAALDPVGKALKVIATFRLVLQMVFKWIADVSGAATAVAKTRSLVRKAAKLLRAEVKDAVRVVKEVQRLKPA